MGSTLIDVTILKMLSRRPDPLSALALARTDLDRPRFACRVAEDHYSSSESFGPCSLIGCLVQLNCFLAPSRKGSDLASPFGRCTFQ